MFALPHSLTRNASPGSDGEGGQREFARRCAKLAAQFAELSPKIQVALNSHLSRLGDDPKAASIGSFDEAEIMHGNDFSLHVVSINSGSLFQDIYVAGNVCDQLIVNPGESELRFRVFSQRFENEDFNLPRRLEFVGELTLAPQQQFFAGEDSTAVFPEVGDESSVFLALRSRATTPYTWMYDAKNLEPSYPVCVDPNVTQLLFILNTLSRTGTHLPAELEKRLALHADFSVRWAVADYMLRNEPQRAMGRLRELSEHDRDLGERARRRIAFLENLRSG